MARKTKVEAARAAAALRKRESRERSKMTGFTRLHLEPEVYTAEILAHAAKAQSCSVGSIVVELMEAVPVDSLGAEPKWYTPDCTAQDLEITVPVAVSMALSGHPWLSAGSVLEWLVLERCWILTPDDVGLIDSVGHEITDNHAECGYLCYVHPGNKIFVVTRMCHHKNGLVYANGKPYDKYVARLACRSEASRQQQGTSEKNSWDEGLLAEMAQKIAVSRVQESQHRQAWSAHEEQIHMRGRQHG